MDRPHRYHYHFLLFKEFFPYVVILSGFILSFQNFRALMFGICKLSLPNSYMTVCIQATFLYTGLLTHITTISFIAEIRVVGT